MVRYKNVPSRKTKKIRGNYSTGRRPTLQRGVNRRAANEEVKSKEIKPHLQLLDVNGKAVNSLVHTLDWPLAPADAVGEQWTSPVAFNEDNFGWKIYDINNRRYLDEENYTVVRVEGDIKTINVEKGGLTKTIPTEKIIDYYLFDKNTADLLVDITAPTQEELDTALNTRKRILTYKDFYAPVVTWEDPTTPIQYEKYSGNSEFLNLLRFTYGDEFWTQADLETTVELMYNNKAIVGATDDASIAQYMAAAATGEYTYKVTVKDKYGYINQLYPEGEATKIIQVVDTTKPVIEVTMVNQDIEVGGSNNINYGKVMVSDSFFGGAPASVTLDAELGTTEVYFPTGHTMGKLTVALTKEGVAVTSIDATIVGVYEVKFDFTDGTNDAVQIIRTVTIKAAPAPEPEPTTNWFVVADMLKDEFEASSGNTVNYGQVSNVNDGVSRVSGMIVIHSGLTFPYSVNLTNANDTTDSLGTLKITLTKDDVEINGLIDTSATGNYKLTFEFTDGAGGSGTAEKTFKIIPKAAVTNEYSLLVGGYTEADADMVIVYDGNSGGVSVVIPGLADNEMWGHGTQYNFNGLSFVLPLDDLAPGEVSGEDNSAVAAMAKFEELIKWRDGDKKGAQFTNISTWSSPVGGGVWNDSTITQKYQTPIIPQRAKGGAQGDEAKLENNTLDTMNNISTGTTGRTMHLILAAQPQGTPGFSKSNVKNDNHLNTKLWTHTSQIKYVTTDNTHDGIKINSYFQPTIDNDFYDKEWNKNDERDADVNKPWIPSRKELLKFFGWSEPQIDAVLASQPKEYALKSKYWASGVNGMSAPTDRAEKLRGYIRIGDYRPPNGAQVATKNNIVKGIDIGGGECDSIAAALFTGNDSSHPKFYSAIGKIDSGNDTSGFGAKTDNPTFRKVAFKFKKIFP